jgi:hypothetical protein
MDRDGRGDVVALHGGWYRAGLYLQTSSGTLGPESLFQIPIRNSLLAGNTRSRRYQQRRRARHRDRRLQQRPRRPTPGSLESATPTSAAAMPGSPTATATTTATATHPLRPIRQPWLRGHELTRRRARRLRRRGRRRFRCPGRSALERRRDRCSGCLLQRFRSR